MIALIIIIVLAIVGAIVGALVVLKKKKGKGGSSGSGGKKSKGKGGKGGKGGQYGDMSALPSQAEKYRIPDEEVQNAGQAQDDVVIGSQVKAEMAPVALQQQPKDK